MWASVKSHVAQTTDFKALIRVPEEFLPSDYSSAFDDLASLGGTDIYWLYNTGSSLMGFSNTINDILNFSIGGYNLVTILFGGGFIVYVGWVIAKWIIPL